jgi:CRISPR-associated protein Cas1
MTNVLNTLYVTIDGASVHLEGTSLRVVVEKKVRVQVPIHHLTSLVLMARVYVTPQAMEYCAENAVSVAFMTGNGRYLARVEGRAVRSAALRREQYRAADDLERSLAIARGFVAGKIANSRTFIRRVGRTREGAEEGIDNAAERLVVLGRRALEVVDFDVLRGTEGEAAALYFELFDTMVDRENMRFERRTRRPPGNPVNALLSFGYALLAADCQSALQSAGLDPSVGFLHVERPGRPALALDLMEELRAPVVDRLVVSTIRLGQFAPKDFETLPTGECRFTDDARRRFIVEYQERKRDEVVHPLASESVSWGLVPLLQARLLARAVRRETAYLPFLLKLLIHEDHRQLRCADYDSGGPTSFAADSSGMQRVWGSCSIFGVRVLARRAGAHPPPRHAP